MIHINIIEEVTSPVITKMPAAEFCGRGNLHEDCRFIYELEMSPGLTLVLDELQLSSLVEAARDALPPMFEPGEDDDAEAWKEGGAS